MRLNRHLIIAASLVLLTLVAYFRVVSLEFVNYDDPDYISSNPKVAQGLTIENIAWAFTSDTKANWHPLTWMSLMLDVSLFDGVNDKAEHAVNLCFHLLDVVLLFFALRRLTRTDWPSAMVAALFAVHPIHVESVAWVSERKDVLSMMFAASALWAYAKYAEENSILNYCVVVGLFALGLMAKPMLVTLPFVFLLLDYWPLKRLASGAHSPSKPKIYSPDKLSAVNIRQRTLGWLVLEKLPLLAMSIISSVITYSVQRGGGAMSFAEFIPLDARLSNASTSYFIYLRKIFWPGDLSMMYPLNSHASQQAMTLALLFLVGMTAVVFYFASRGKGYLAVGWLWFLGTLVPVIGLVQVGMQGMADRYMYLPAIGIYIMLVFGLADLASAWSDRGLKLGIPACLVLLVCVLLTFRQIGFWSNTRAIYDRALAVDSTNPLAHMQYAEFYLSTNRYEEAIAECNKAIDVAPQYPQPYANKGYALLVLGRTDEAITACRKALKLAPTPFILARIRLTLASALARTGDVKQARQELDEILSKDPDNPDALFSLANLDAKEGHRQEAIYHLKQILKVYPDNKLIQTRLNELLASTPAQALAIAKASLQAHPEDIELADRYATMLINNHDIPGAIGAYYQILTMNPKDSVSRTNLGMILIYTGRVDNGIKELETVLQDSPDHLRALNTLAWVKATFHDPKVRNGAEAVRWAERAVEANKEKEPGIYDTLGAAYAETGKFDKAIEAAETGVKLAKAAKAPALVNEINGHLQLYRENKPFHEEVPTETPAQPSSESPQHSTDEAPALPGTTPATPKTTAAMPNSIPAAPKTSAAK